VDVGSVSAKAGEEGEKTAEAKEGVSFANILSFSRNGSNTYATNLVSGRLELASWLSMGADMPFVHVETVQTTASSRHEYLGNGPGDLVLSLRADLAEVGGRRRASGAAPAGTKSDGWGDAAAVKDDWGASGGWSSPAAPAGWNASASSAKAEEPAPSSSRGDALHVTIGLNLACPTGLTDLYYEDPAGNRVDFPQDSQLGSGIWKPGVSLGAFRRVGPFYPVGQVSYVYGRTVNAAGTRYSDVFNAGFGLLAWISPSLQWQVTPSFTAAYNVHDIRSRDPVSGATRTEWGSHGWLLFAGLDSSIRLMKDLSFEAGVTLPVYKTVRESPNDLDFSVKGGLRLAF
jgi:hypothetical protein